MTTVEPVIESILLIQEYNKEAPCNSGTEEEEAEEEESEDDFEIIEEPVPRKVYDVIDLVDSDESDEDGEMLPFKRIKGVLFDKRLDPIVKLEDSKQNLGLQFSYALNNPNLIVDESKPLSVESALSVLSNIRQLQKPPFMVRKQKSKSVLRWKRKKAKGRAFKLRTLRMKKALKSGQKPRSFNKLITDIKIIAKARQLEAQLSMLDNGNDDDGAPEKGTPVEAQNGHRSKAASFEAILTRSKDAKNRKPKRRLLSRLVNQVALHPELSNHVFHLHKSASRSLPKVALHSKKPQPKLEPPKPNLKPCANGDGDEKSKSTEEDLDWGL